MPIASGETRWQDECGTKFIQRSVDISSATQGCILWWFDGRAAVRPVALRRRRRRRRRRKFRRFRQSCGWNLVLQRGNLLPKTIQSWENPLAHGANSSVDQESQKNTEPTWDHSLHTSPDTSHCMEAVLSMVRKICGKPAGDPIFGRMFMNAALRAAVHLGKDYDTNLRFIINHLWKTTGQLFMETDKLISGQPETTGISLINFQDFRWVLTSLLHGRAYQYPTANVCIFSESALCTGEMRSDPNAVCRNKIEWFPQNNCLNIIESHRGHADGIRVENLPRIHDVRHPQRDSKTHEKYAVWTWARQRKNHLHVNVRWHYVVREENEEICKSNAHEVADFARRHPCGFWSFLGLGLEKTWYKLQQWWYSNWLQNLVTNF